MCMLQKVSVETMAIVIPPTMWKPEDTSVSMGEASASQRVVVRSVPKDN